MNIGQHTLKALKEHEVLVNEHYKGLVIGKFDIVTSVLCTLNSDNVEDNNV